MKKYKIEAFENLVSSFEELPNIGKKSAIKMAYYLIMENKFLAKKLAHAIEEGVKHIQKCKKCHNMSENELCHICSDEYRDHSKLCIVQSAKDIITIENSGRYNGLYYIIREIKDLDEYHLRKIAQNIEEIIFAFPPSIATDTMILYIEEKLKGLNITFTKIAQGVPTGVSLDNIDLLSLSKALEDRVRV
jgi:recombination protein RecR